MRIREGFAKGKEYGTVSRELWWERGLGEQESLGEEERGHRPSQGWVNKSFINIILYYLRNSIGF